MPEVIFTDGRLQVTLGGETDCIELPAEWSIDGLAAELSSTKGGTIEDWTADLQAALDQASADDALGPEHPELAELQWKPFPVELLPAELQRFVRYISKAVGADEAMAAMFSLATCAGAIGAARRLELDPEWTVPALLWVAVVAPQSSKKSPILDKSTGPLEAIDAELPNDQQVVIDDITVQALAPTLQANRGGLLAKRDELSTWFVSLDQYNTRSDGQWCSLYNGGTLRFKRRGGPEDERNIKVPHACVSIVGGVQPATLADLMERKYQTSGLGVRWLFVQPPKRRHRYIRGGKCPSGTEGYRRVIRDLYHLRTGGAPEPTEWNPDGDQPPDEFFESDQPKRGNLEGFTIDQLTLTLADDAGDLWEQHVNRVQDEAFGMSDDLLEAVRMKLIGTAGRLALILQLADEPEAAEVSSRWLRAGIDLAEWLFHESRRVWSGIRGTVPANLRDLLDWLRRQGDWRTSSQVRRSGPKAYRAPGGSAKAEADLQELRRSGLVESRTSKATQGGRPAEEFRALDT